MSDHWLASQLEQADNTLPLHERLAQCIAQAIEDGHFNETGRLPTHREIARTAAVSIGTVTKAIDVLTARGLVRGQVGRGTFIIAPSITLRTGVIDLSANVPPPVVPESVMLQVAERAVRNVLHLPSSGLYDHKGSARQRQVFAQWLARDRVSLDPEEIVLCTGAQQAIYLAFSDLRPHSRLIASECETFSGAVAAAADLEMNWVAVEHDSQGMLPDKLDAALQATGCKIVYTIPVCQNPLGFEVGQTRREAIAAVAKKHDAYIVEDDIYGIYAVSGSPTYKELDPDRVYFATSLSKCLTPLLRAGVLAPPQQRLNGIARQLRALVLGASPIALEMGCVLLETGADRAAAAALRDEARARTTIAQALLGLDSVPMPSGSPHLWLPLRPVEAERLARRAGEQGIRLTPPDAGTVGPSSGGLRLCILAPALRSDMEQALKQLASLIDDPDEVVV